MNKKILKALTRTVSLLIIMVMTMGIFPFSVFAGELDGNDTQPATEFSETEPAAEADSEEPDQEIADDTSADDVALDGSAVPSGDPDTTTTGPDDTVNGNTGKDDTDAGTAEDGDAASDTE